MNRRARRTLTTTSLISAAVVATMAAAITATWTFLPGGEITAFNDGNMGVVTSRGTVITCTRSPVKANAKSGSGLSGEDIGSINEIAFEGNQNSADNRCESTPGSILVRVIPRNLPWEFSVESYDPTSGVVSGKVTGVKVEAQGSDGCSAEITAPNGGPGEVPVTYDNSTGTVTTDPSRFSLVVANLNGTPPCDPTLIQIGDGVAVAGAWVVQPTQEVTSP